MVQQRMSSEDTKVAMHSVVGEMYDKIVKGEPPTMTLPVRTKNNIGFDKKLGVRFFKIFDINAIMKN